MVDIVGRAAAIGALLGCVIGEGAGGAADVLPLPQIGTQALLGIVLVELSASNATSLRQCVAAVTLVHLDGAAISSCDIMGERCDRKEDGLDQAGSHDGDDGKDVSKALPRKMG